MIFYISGSASREVCVLLRFVLCYEVLEAKTFRALLGVVERTH